MASTDLPHITYDPVPETPHSPRLPPDGSEFSAPTPRFMDGSVNSSTSTVNNFRQSEYGSVAGLKTIDSSSPVTETGVNKEREGDAGRLSRDLNEKNATYAAPRAQTKRKLLIWSLVALGLVVVTVAIAVPVAVLKGKDGSSGSESSNSGSSSHEGHSGTTGHDSGNTQTVAATWGGDGSIVTKEDGTTFVYNNTFGGYWVFDPANPFNNSARAQEHVPPLAEEWRWGQDKVFGVNLGGWLTLEPFISPALYEPFYPNAVDEWTLSQLIQQRDGNLNAIEEHYKTFIVEEDFAMIAAAGLNWVRLPLPFWAIEKYADEPFLERVSWTYFLKAIEWARKYGIRINLDFHALPGSQNGWNHSGKLGQINFLNGVMGVANAQRALDYIRILAEFISQPEYKDVVPFFGIVNEPRSGDAYPASAIQAFYAEAYRIIRNAGGQGAGNGPFISIHEAFQGLANFADFLTGADRLALDSHPYLAFGAMTADPVESFVTVPCTTWGNLFSDSLNTFGMTTAGEWSHAINDCGLYLNAVGRGTRYEGTFESTVAIGSCDTWNDYASWTQATKDALKQFSMSSMDALQNWFFWTWRIGESSATGKVMTPFWSYKLALQEGWAPTDPREAAGQCSRLGVDIGSFSGTLQSWQVGGAGAGTIPTLDTYPWPPASIGGAEGAAAVAALPVYTRTGDIVTLPGPTFSSAPTAGVGNGWANAADTTPMAVPIAGCTYPDPWDALSAVAPACATAGTAGAVKREAAPAPAPTAMP